MNNSRFSLADKVIVLTGGTGIIGQSFIKGITDAGGTVCILGRNEKVAAERAEEVIKAGGQAMAVIADVLDEESLIRAKDEILRKYGKIDGLVNAAGGNIPEAIVQKDDDIFDMNLGGLRKALELNLWGTLIPAQIFGKAMLAGNGGSIVNISSMSAFDCGGSGQALYSITKSAVVRMTEVLSVEWAAYGINVNALAPGAFYSEMMDGMIKRIGEFSDQFPRKRICDPALLDSSLLYLVGPSSEAVTGTCIKVDDGQHRR